MVYTVNGTQFTRRKRIKLTHSGELTDYHLKLTIAYEAAMQVDFDDIIFTTQAGVNIPYWLESKTDSNTADIWIKYDQGDGDTYILMYYGNAGLSSASSIDIFILGDDFNDASIDTSIWDTVNNDGTWNEAAGVLTGSDGDGFWMRSKVVGTDYHIWAYGKASDMDSAYIMANVNVTTDPWTNGYAFRALGGSDDLIIVRAGSQVAIETVTLTANTYYYHEIKKVGGDLTYKIYDSSKTLLQTVTYSDGTPLTGDRIAFRGYAETLTTDWIILGKSTTTEPTYTVGTEQHQRRTPQFIN